MPGMFPRDSLKGCGLMLIGFTVYNLRILSRLEFKTTGDKK